MGYCMDFLESTVAIPKERAEEALKAFKEGCVGNETIFPTHLNITTRLYEGSQKTEEELLIPHFLAKEIIDAILFGILIVIHR